MAAIRQSCQLAARRATPSTYTASNGSVRAFSCTASRPRGKLPVFEEPSSPDLQQLLYTFNSKILLPKHLTKDQKALVFRPENKARLEAEPIEINLGDVTLPLEHLERFNLPSIWTTFRAIVKASNSDEDAENLLRLLEGIHGSSLKMRGAWRELVVRKLFASGHAQLVVKALRRASATGLSLSDRGVLLQVVRGIHDMAATADGDEQTMDTALRFAEQIVELMHHDAHCGKGVRLDKKRELVAAETGKTPQIGDWTKEPFVIAMPLEAAALLSLKHDYDTEDVKKYALRLVAALQQSPTFETRLSQISTSSLTPPPLPTASAQQTFQTTHAHALLELTVIWSALKTSRIVLGTAMPQAAAAQDFETAIEKVLDEGIACVDALQASGEARKVANAYVEYVKGEVRKVRDVQKE